jgi:peptidyl-prolyl cis-trans isomerase C
MILFSCAPHRRRGLAIAASLGVVLFAAGFASAEPKVLAKIDGAPITEDDVNDALEDIGPGLPQKLDGPARQQYALDYLIDMKLVAKKAAADKMDSGAAFDRRMAYYHDKLAMEAMLTAVAAKAATDENERKAYDEAAKGQPPVPEIHARHILLPTEEEAKAALARVKAGEDFAKVATELSKDPVKSQFGWHIIKVEEKRMKTFPPFEQVKDQAARYVVQKAQADLIASLHQSVKIERTEPPKPAADAAPAAPADAAKPADAPADAKKP